MKCGCAATSSSRGSSLTPPERVCLGSLRVVYTTPSEPHCPAQVRPSRSRVIQSLLAALGHVGSGTAFDTTFSIIDKDPTRNAEGHSIRHTLCLVPLTPQADALRTSIPARHHPPHGLTLNGGRAALGLSPPTVSLAFAWPAPLRPTREGPQFPRVTSICTASHSSPVAVLPLA